MRHREALCVTVETREDVGGIVDRATTVGGKVDPNPPQDHGFMISRSVRTGRKCMGGSLDVAD